MGRACGTQQGGERHRYRIWLGNSNKETTWKTQEGEIILKCMIKK